MMSDHILKAFEAAFGVWTTTGYFKHKPTQHQLDGFRKGYAIAEQTSAERIAQLEKALAVQNHIPDAGKMVQAQPKQEPIYQLKMSNGSWIDQERESYEYNVKHGNEMRIVYPAIQSQAQEPESKPFCKNCLGTGVEFGVYKNFSCSFCVPAPEGDSDAK